MTEPMTAERLAFIKRMHRNQSPHIKQRETSIQMGELIAEVERLNQFEAAVKDAHRLFDRLGIPKAAGQPCDDPECDTHTGHRLRQLIKELAEWKHRAIGGTCRILSVGEACDCSLCQRDIEIAALKAELAEAKALLSPPDTGNCHGCDMPRKDCVCNVT